MSFPNLCVRCLPLLLLLSALSMADNDRNYKIAPNLFKIGVGMHEVADMPIVHEGGLSISETPTIPLKPNTIYLRQKKGPKEYHWFSGQLNVEHFTKLHAFSLKENYLKSSEVMGMRFYATSNAKAFQDESDIYFDKEYIYSPRVPKLFFRKNERWQMLQETELPGVITINSQIKDLNTVSITTKIVDSVPSRIYPVKPGMYAFSFSAPDHLPFVDAVYVPSGSVVEITPKLIAIDTTTINSPTTSITMDSVNAAQTLEQTEYLYDKLTYELQRNVALVDTNDFTQMYPVPKHPLTLNTGVDEPAYHDYTIRFKQKRLEALDQWRSSKMGTARLINKALRQKLDSLQALPLRGAMIPSKMEPVYSINPETSERAVVGVRIFLGRDHERYDVSWNGYVDGYTPDSLYTVMAAGASVRAIITLENNKPVWFYDEGILRGRYQYRYTKLELEVDGKIQPSHGSFELPPYIFDMAEVQDWLNRPVEPPTPPQELKEERKQEAKADEGLHLDVNLNAPRIIRDKFRGAVALIDSGSFRYYGKVVSMSPFAIHTTEVTQQQFKEVMSKIDSTQRIEDRSTFLAPLKPVHNINWNDARKYCQAIGGDLPTEAQWEFAGRADNNEGALWNLDEEPNVNAYAVYRDNSYKMGKNSFDYGPQPVGSKKPNQWGLYDMSGNVAEWTRDNYFMFSFWVEASNPTGALMGTQKVYKGGSWKDKEDDLNLTERDDEDPRYWSDAIGFRCAFPRSIFDMRPVEQAPVDESKEQANGQGGETSWSPFAGN